MGVLQWIGTEQINEAYPFSNFIYLCIQEVQVLIKVLVLEQAFPDHL